MDKERQAERRVACLQLAASMANDPTKVVELAKAYADFVEGLVSLPKSGE